MKIYVIFTCDEWKMTNSMKFVGVASTRKQLNKILKQMAEEDVIEISIKNYMLDLNWPINDINDSLKYAYIEEREMNDFEY